MVARLLLSVLIVLTLVSCVGGSSPVSNFYLLEPISEAVPVTEKHWYIGMRPVKVPDYVDRPQIVTATAKNTYHLSEFNRWAETLDQNITRVLAQSLTHLLSADILMTNISSFAKQADIQLAVNILEFHVNPQGQAVLNVQSILSKDKKLLSSRQMTYRAEASNTDYRLMVAGLNECLHRLSRDIARSIAALEK